MVAITRAAVCYALTSMVLCAVLCVHVCVRSCSQAARDIAQTLARARNVTYLPSSNMLLNMGVGGGH